MPSLVATYKAEALYGYLGDKTYQPMTTYWAEQDMVVHSEFRDGNVPANYQNLRAVAGNAGGAAGGGG